MRDSFPSDCVQNVGGADVSQAHVGSTNWSTAGPQEKQSNTVRVSARFDSAHGVQRLRVPSTGGKKETKQTETKHPREYK